MINQFSTGDWIGIISTVISTVLGFIFWQRIRKKGVIFLIKKHFAINTIKPEQFSFFKVSLDNVEINNFLYNVSGTIIITGDGDIPSEDIVHPISLKTDDVEGLWKKYDIVNKTDLLDCTINEENDILKFNTSNYKENDYIQFDAYYSANKIGIKAIQRILNVDKKVRILNEDSRGDYAATSVIAFLFLVVILFTSLSETKFFKSSTEKVNYTKSTEVHVYSKEDSLRLKIYQYNKLYSVNNINLDDDSSFLKNKALNKKLNDQRKKIELIKLDSIYSTKKSKYLKISDSINIIDKDSIYYYDNDILEENSNTILKKLLKDEMKITDDGKYKINDTISVSFIKSRSLSEDNTFDYIMIIFTIFLIFICGLLGIWAYYNFRLISKYKKLYSSATNL